MAQRTASTTLRNSTNAPSPVRLMTRPLWIAIVGSMKNPDFRFDHNWRGH